MPSRSRFAASLARQIFGIIVLISFLFVAGCKSSDNSSTIFYISSPTILPNGAVSLGGGTYTATLQATGGIAPYTWGLVAFVVIPIPQNVLPPGLTLSPSGVISGMPATAGTYNFTVQVADSGGLTVTGNASITITAPLTIGASGTTLANAVVGAVYPTTTLGVIGGIGNLTCTLNSGPLPSGLALSNATTAWAISGTVGSSVAPGSYPFTIKCTDAQNDSVVSSTITITVNAAGPVASPSSTVSSMPGSCNSGNEGLLSGQYAFLTKGSSAIEGYSAVIGSFTADGKGGISGGQMDRNATSGPVTGLSISATGSSYSVGSDNRGCLTLADSSGGTLTFRIALGMVSGSPAISTEGAMTGAAANGTTGIQVAGILMQQGATSFSPAALRGTYVFGHDGVDATGGRYAEAGLSTSDGNGSLTGITADSDDVYVGPATTTGGSGIYTLASNGRGTATSMIGGTTAHSVIYVVSSSELLSLSTDPVDSTHPILSGENKLQTAAAFATFPVAGSDDAFYTTGVDPSSGGGTVSLGQATFTNSSGSATLTLDVNDNGIEEAESAGETAFMIAANGRMTATGAGFGTNSHPPIIYMVDSTQGFLIGTDPAVSSGYFEQQSGAPFSTESIAGDAYFGGSAPATGSPYDSGTLSFVASSGTVTGTDDGSSPAFLANNGTPVPYTFSATTSFAPSAAGQGLIGNGTLAYIISASPLKIIFMPKGATAQNANGSPAELFVGQQ